MKLENKRVRINVVDCLWFLYLISIVKLEGIEIVYPIFAYLWKRLSILLSIGIFIFLIKIGNIQKHIWIEIMSLMFSVISTAMFQPVNLKIIVFQIYLCIEMLLALFCLFQIEGFDRSLKILTSVFAFLLLINCLSMILYPNGMIYINVINGNEIWKTCGRNFVRTLNSRVGWILGHQGLITIYAVPGTVISLVKDFRKKNKVNISFTSIFIIGLSLIEIFLFSKSANCIITYVILWILIFVFYFGNKIQVRKWIPNIKTVIIFLLLLFYLILYKNILIYFQTIIMDLLHRDISLTGRMVVWKNSIIAILRRPILGYGYVRGAEGWKIFISAAHPHNQFLYIAFQGGLLALCLFIVYIVLTTEKLKKTKYVFCMPLLFAGVCSLLIGMIGDRYIPYYSIAFVLFEVVNYFPCDE